MTGDPARRRGERPHLIGFNPFPKWNIVIQSQALVDKHDRKPECASGSLNLVDSPFSQEFLR